MYANDMTTRMAFFQVIGCWQLRMVAIKFVNQCCLRCCLVLRWRSDNGSGNNERKVVGGRGQSHGWRNSAAWARARYYESRGAFRACAFGCASAGSKVLRTACGDEQWRDFGAIRGSGSKIAHCSLRFTAGSPKASTHAILRRLRPYSMRCRHELQTDERCCGRDRSPGARPPAPPGKPH